MDMHFVPVLGTAVMQITEPDPALCYDGVG